MVENASDNGSLIPATPPVSTACMRDKPKRSGESVGSGGREKARKKEEEGDDGQIRLCCPRQSQPPLHFARARFEEQQKIEGGLKLKKPPPPPPVVPVCKPTSLSPFPFLTPSPRVSMLLMFRGRRRRVVGRWGLIKM